MEVCLGTALQQVGPVPAHDYDQILSAWQARTVAEGEFLVQAGSSCSELYFIQEGVCRILAQPLQGKEVTFGFMQEGQFCTILASFLQQLPNPNCIQAACPAKVLVISRAGFDNLCGRFPYLSGLFTQLIQRTLLKKIQIRQTYLGQDAATNYELFLTQQPGVARRVPQHMIASYLGITPQSLSRLRKGRA